ncbi:acyltransferase [Spirosoma sp. SC4-14]|uniref:acyltransferase family protein n=1 Tax=Spirosoma sp. SC4-14 TaxID=3128900 RepID=UPI0030D0D1D9
MKAGSNRAIWLDYLRAFVTLLVVAHHAAMAYPTYGYFNPAQYILSTAPVVDQARWLGMDVFIGFNDLFFMPLMFLISGLFVYRGLERKGTQAYLADRAIRLGIPFLIAECVLIPLAYVPSYYLATHSFTLEQFISDYIVHQQWPVGPPWFIWLLLVFDGLAVLIYRISPTIYPVMGQWFLRQASSPIRFGIILFGLVALSLIPLSLWVGQYTWIGRWGPFDFQLNRLLFYLLFFLLGSCLGATSWEPFFFYFGKLFGKNWLFWVGLSIGCYVFFLAVSDFGTAQVRQGNLTETQGFFFYDLAFVGSCLASIGACLSIFKQIFTRPVRFWTSVSANAYTIYMVHYGFVTWLQFALLWVNVPAFAKFIFVCMGAASLSWLCSNLLRRNSYIAQLL